MKTIVSLLVLILTLTAHAQISEPLAMNTNHDDYYSIDTTKKVFSKSELAGVDFIVSSNLRENTLLIKTNFSGNYKVRFIDYYAGSRKVFKNQQSNITIDVSEFEKSIFIMNITDSQNRLLTSQVVNLKRKHL